MTFPRSCPDGWGLPSTATLAESVIGSVQTIRNAMAMVGLLHGDEEVEQVRVAGGVDLDRGAFKTGVYLMSYAKWLEAPLDSYCRENGGPYPTARWLGDTKAKYGIVMEGHVFTHNNDGTPMKVCGPQKDWVAFIQQGWRKPDAPFALFDVACHSVALNAYSIITQRPLMVMDALTGTWLIDALKAFRSHVAKLREAIEQDDPTEQLRAIRFADLLSPFSEIALTDPNQLKIALRALVAAVDKNQDEMRLVPPDFLKAVPLYKKKERVGFSFDDATIPVGIQYVAPNETRGKRGESHKRKREESEYVY